jgi:methionyl aminopeptidase
MSRDPVKAGDVLSIDIGVRNKGWIGDAAWTYSFGEPDKLTRALMESGKESLRRGINAMQPRRPLIDWAKAVQGHVEKECGFHLVRGLGGHGIGRSLHGPPFISNVVPTYPGEWGEAWKPWQPGMIVAVEPMIAIGTTETRTKGREWPIWTADGSLAVHYEADVLITEQGPRNLTEGLFELPDVIAG